MIARDIISDSIPPLKPTDTGAKALEWMREFGVDHLPVVNDRHFEGLIAEEDVLNLNEPERPLKEYKFSYKRPYIRDKAHLFEVIKLAIDLNLTLIPVIDEKEQFMGTITPACILRCLGKLSSFTDPGAILVLEMKAHDYSLSTVARIVESTDVKILSSYVHTEPETSMVELTLKLDKSELSSTIAALERFEYVVKFSFLETEYTDDLKDRFDSLMHYLDI